MLSTPRSEAALGAIEKELREHGSEAESKNFALDMFHATIQLRQGRDYIFLMDSEVYEHAYAFYTTSATVHFKRDEGKRKIHILDVVLVNVF